MWTKKAVWRTRTFCVPDTFIYSLRYESALTTVYDSNDASIPITLPGIYNTSPRGKLTKKMISRNTNCHTVLQYARLKNEFKSKHIVDFTRTSSFHARSLTGVATREECTVCNLPAHPCPPKPGLDCGRVTAQLLHTASCDLFYRAPRTPTAIQIVDRPAVPMSLTCMTSRHARLH